MIDVKQAVQAARVFAMNVLDRQAPTVEEVEREVYDNHDTWRITLGFDILFASIGTPKEYRSFFVDADSGEVLAVKIRQLTT